MRHWPLVLVGVLIAALGVLATLQVRWIADVSASRQHRLRSELDGAVRRFNDEIGRDIARLAAASDDATARRLIEPARRLFATENPDGFDVAIVHGAAIM